MKFACSALGVFALALAVLPKASQAAGPRECELYARRAVQQFQLTLNPRFGPRCRIAPSQRWQASYQSHHGRVWLRSEEGARDAHLYRCGAQVRFD
jgi:hypothetical protein